MTVDKPPARSADAPVYRPTRRIVFTGLASLGVAAALAGCGGGSDASSGSGEGGSSGGATAEAGTELAKTSEIPVQGGLILADDNMVITQPTEGTFKAFSATCTHQGFTVSSVEDDTIRCNQHGSQFSAVDGSVKQGPAGAALKELAIKVDGTSILAA